MRKQKKRSDSELRDISIVLFVFSITLIVIVLSTAEDTAVSIRMHYLLARMGIVAMLFSLAYRMVLRPRMSAKKLSRPAHTQGEYLFAVTTILLNTAVFLLTDIGLREYCFLMLLIAFILGLVFLPMYLTLRRSERWRDRYSDGMP